MDKFLEDFKSTVVSAANKVTQKTGEIYERSKITISISGVQSDIEKLYKEIGKMVYEGREDDDVSLEDVTAKCSEIDVLMQELEELERKKAIVKNAKICGSCGAEVSSTSTYCAKCGEKIF